MTLTLTLALTLILALILTVTLSLTLTLTLSHTLTRALTLNPIQMGAYMSHPAVRRSLAALAQGPGGDTQMPMPFIPLSSLGGAAQKGAAAPAAAAAASEESDHLLASLLDAAGADQLPGSDG